MGKNSQLKIPFCLILGVFLSLSTCFDPDSPYTKTPSPNKRTSRDDERVTYAIYLKKGADPIEIADKHGHEYIGRIGNLRDHHIFMKKRATVYGVTHPAHSSSNEILFHEEQVWRQLVKRSPPDPLYRAQWHLHNKSDWGNVHVNVEKAWESNITGMNVVIAIVDDGIDWPHPDMFPNFLPFPLSHDFNDNDNNPLPMLASDDHGTSAAGTAAAASNNACGVGSAPKAKLAGLRLISGPSTDAMEASALSWANGDPSTFSSSPAPTDYISIYSNSWGPPDDGRRKEGPGRLAAMAIQLGIERGREGRGNIFVWAGGNGRRSRDNCNYDGWANSRYTIAVGALNFHGKQAWYSEDCAALLVSAPSSGASQFITTTDLLGQKGTARGNCTSSFGGTSAAAPLVAGITALVLQSNPSLTWRDVQGVLLNSARKNDPSSGSWSRNGAGLWISHKFGYGLVDSSAAVILASQWNRLPPQRFLHQTFTPSSNFPISSSHSVTTIIVQPDFTLEQVEVRFEATHSRIGEISITLTSPSGTPSILATPHSDSHTRYNWSFGSMRHWGENSSGNWSLDVWDDVSSASRGSLTSWTLSLFGY